ncbi:MAG: adenosylcobinamide-GDP ribazoletransferase [Ilumatobacteraceae bacterium]
MSGFLGAVQFLTRIPVRTANAVPHERVVPWFAVVGALIGAAVKRSLPASASSCPRRSRRFVPSSSDC